MDEARRVIERLTRIEALEAEGGDPKTVLAELRALVREAEAWVRVEHGAEEAWLALERCSATLSEPSVRAG